MVIPKRYTCYLSTPDFEYLEPFSKILRRVSKPEDADVILFTGGADIHPRLYNEEVGKYTWPNVKRDEDELPLYKWAKQNKKKILGICRGAQLLCVMAGGKLIQHITGHQHGEHRIITNQGEEFLTSTSHHQMMYPIDVEHELIAWTEKLSSCYLNGEDEPYEGLSTEPEIVYFPSIKGLAIQGHPEYLPTESLVNEYHRELVLERLL